jgi:predicted small lipoprotein YifL
MSSYIPSRAAGALLLFSLASCGGKTQVSSPPAGAPAPAAPTQSVSVTDGESLIRAMHAKYSSRWYRTLTFTQTTTLLQNTGPNNDQYWYEALSLPGRLRIDYGNPDLGNGVLFRSDSTYQISSGRVARAFTGWNDLLILTQDVYLQPPEVTISVLRSLGIQMSRIRTSTFDGRTAYVVGSTSVTDSSSKQFWVERDRLLLVRVREKRAEGQWSDIRLGDFIAVGNGFIAKQTYQMINGFPRLHQQVAGPKADVALDPALFDPRQWSTVKHWSKP